MNTTLFHIDIIKHDSIAVIYPNDHAPTTTKFLICVFKEHVENDMPCEVFSAIVWENQIMYSFLEEQDFITENIGIAKSDLKLFLTEALKRIS